MKILITKNHEYIDIYKYVYIRINPFLFYENPNLEKLLTLKFFIE